METAEPFLGERSRRWHGVDFEGAWDGGACVAAEMERLGRHEPLDGFRDVMERLDKVRGDAEAGNVLAFHHDDWPGIVADAEQLNEDEALGEAERNRLQAVLDEHEAHAAEWEVVEMLRRDLEEREEEERRLGEKAESEGIPLTLLPGWQDCHDDARNFVKEAGAALADEDLRRNGHWRSRPEVEARLEEAREAARGLDQAAGEGGGAGHGHDPRGACASSRSVCRVCARAPLARKGNACRRRPAAHRLPSRFAGRRTGRGLGRPGRRAGAGRRSWNWSGWPRSGCATVQMWTFTPKTSRRRRSGAPNGGTRSCATRL